MERESESEIMVKVRLYSKVRYITLNTHFINSQKIVPFIGIYFVKFNYLAV